MFTDEVLILTVWPVVCLCSLFFRFFFFFLVLFLLVASAVVIFVVTTIFIIIVAAVIVVFVVDVVNEVNDQKPKQCEREMQQLFELNASLYTLS